MLGKINSKLDSLEKNVYTYRFRKHHLIPVLTPIILLVLALPIVVLGSKVQTNTFSNAQTLAAAATPTTHFYEDLLPTDAPVANSSAVQIQAAQVDAQTSTVATTTKPNIVVIMLDDINPLDGRLWQPSIMPNAYNNIITTGLQFNHYYGETSLCCPGRVGFFTGQHTQNHGVGNLDGSLFKPGDTIATELLAKGYYTMLVGKYVNNYTAIPASKAIPPGWSKFDALYTGNGKYFNYPIISKTSTGYSMKNYGSTAADYSTDVEANIAITRLKQAPANKPIFAYIAPTAAHTPWTPAPRNVNDPRCATISWAPPNYNEADVSDKPAYVRALPLKTGSTYSLKNFCQTLLSADDMVGRVIKELKAEGRYQNTMFVFTADNGMSWGEHRLDDKTTPYATPLPLYIGWPAVRGTTPAVTDTTISNIDFAPTICEIGGCVMGPYPNGQQTADGQSFLNLLKGQTLPWTRDAILESQPTVTQNGQPLDANPKNRPVWWAVRTTNQSTLGLWHYVEYSTGEKELYDLSNGPCYSWNASKGGDPCELNNLLGPNQTPSAATLALANQLHNRLVQLKAEKGNHSVPPTPTPTITPSPTPTPTPTPGGAASINSLNASATTGTLSLKTGSYYTYKLSGTTVVGRTNTPVTGPVTFKTTAPKIQVTYSGKPLPLVKITSAPGYSSLVGRYINPSTGTWTNP